MYGIVKRNRDIAAKKIKEKLNLQLSLKTIYKYLRLMGWKNIRTKFFQFVSMKNRIDRVKFDELCLYSKKSFDCTIFIDESCIQASKNSNRIRFNRDIPNQTRIGLVERYAHLYSVHVLGGISRVGRSELFIFTGINF